MTALTALTAPGVPFPLTTSTDAVWTVDASVGALSVTAAPHSDIFIDPGASSHLNADAMLNAVTLLGTPPAGDFQLSARVTVDFRTSFDAGVLLLWAGQTHWGKLCFEYSTSGEPTVVSVVSRGVADDADGFVVEGRSVWLRVARIDHAFAYHASLDGSAWRMVRYFALDAAAGPATIGFEAQSPTGDGCVVTFDDIRFTTERLRNLRDGS